MRMLGKDFASLKKDRSNVVGASSVLNFETGHETEV